MIFFALRIPTSPFINFDEMIFTLVGSCLCVCDCRGFAFIHFAAEASVQKVLDDEDHNLDGRAIDVKKAIPHAQHQVCVQIPFH